MKNYQFNDKTREEFIKVLERIIEFLTEKEIYYICIALNFSCEDLDNNKNKKLFLSVLVSHLNNPPDFIIEHKNFNKEAIIKDDVYWKVKLPYDSEEWLKERGEIYNEKIKFINYLIKIYNEK